MGQKFKEDTAGTACLCSVMTVATAEKPKGLGLELSGGGGLRICFQGGILTWLASWCWLLMRWLISLHVWLFSRMPECPHGMAGGLPQSKQLRGKEEGRKRKRKCAVCFLEKALESNGSGREGNRQDWAEGKAELPRRPCCSLGCLTGSAGVGMSWHGSALG